MRSRNGNLRRSRAMASRSRQWCRSASVSRCSVGGENKTMSLTKKLLASFGAMLGLVLLLGAGGLLVTRDLSGDLERAANVTARQQYLAGQVSADSAELTSLERGTVLAAMVADAAHLQVY